VITDIGEKGGEGGQEDQGKGDDEDQD